MECSEVNIFNLKVLRKVEALPIAVWIRAVRSSVKSEAL